MKMLVFLLLLLPLSGAAQYVKVLEGSLKDFKKLKGQPSYNLVFNYDSMVVGKDTPEFRFLEERKDREPAKGSAFEEMWFADRKRRYEPTFLRNFEKIAEVKATDAGAGYTLIIKTVRTEGGWNAGVMRKPAELDLQLWVVETADRSKVMTKVAFLNIEGKKAEGGDLEMTGRIQDAYMYAAKALGDFFRQKTK